MPVSGVAEPTERLLEPGIEEALAEYAGKWVAIRNDAIVAVAEDFAEAYNQARLEFGDDGNILLHRVPDNDHHAYFF